MITTINITSLVKDNKTIHRQIISWLYNNVGEGFLSDIYRFNKNDQYKWAYEKSDMIYNQFDQKPDIFSNEYLYFKNKNDAELFRMVWL